MRDDQAGLWDGVRRTLGRLMGSVRVQELSPSRLAPLSALAAPDVLSWPEPGAGGAETYWRPTASTAAVVLPEAQTGAGGTDLAPIASSIGLNAALGSASSAVHAAALPPGVCTVHRLSVVEDWPQAPVVQASWVALSIGEVTHAAVRLGAPGVAPLSVEAPALHRQARPLWPGRRSTPNDLLHLSGGRVRAGTAVMAQVPLSRNRTPAPPGITAAAAFSSERQRLVQTTGIPESDVVLLGVFPQVPVAAVRRLALEDGGALSLWLKPEALEAVAVGKAPRLATLIVGRQRSTGKMIQTVA